MSYQEHKTAQDSFAENWKTLPQKPPMTEEQMQAWNLNSGLANLAVALQKDMTEIKGLLRQMLDELKRGG